MNIYRYIYLYKKYYKYLSLLVFSCSITIAILLHLLTRISTSLNYYENCISTYFNFYYEFNCFISSYKLSIFF